jgi:hypothetical protein
VCLVLVLMKSFAFSPVACAENPDRLAAQREVERHSWTVDDPQRGSI